MSITKILTIWCEYPGCVEWVETEARTKKGARAEMRRHGWRYVGGKDHCDKHNEKAPGRPTTSAPGPRSSSASPDLAKRATS